MLELKGYITNLGKYNEGALVGKWVTFPIDEDDLQEALKEIECCYYDENGEYINTGYEEFFFTDWDCDIDVDLGEYENIDNINELAEKINNWSEDEDLLKAACELWNIEYILNNNPDEYILYYDIHSDYDLGYYWINDSGCYNLDKMGNLANYIDYEAFGRDIRFESDGGFTALGWVEYVG